MQSNPLTYRSYCWSQTSPLIVVPSSNNGCVIILINTKEKKTNFILSYKRKKPKEKKMKEKKTKEKKNERKKNERNKKEILL